MIARLKGNTKTGKGLMISVLPKNGLDLESVRSKGASSCGDCPHAKAQGKRKTGTCYTYKRPGGGQGVLGGLQKVFETCDEVTIDKFINQSIVLAEMAGFLRLGEFGDPAADKQTAEICAAISQGVNSNTKKAAYTHQWRKAKANALKGLAMASCDTTEETEKALAAGWSVFQVVERKEDIDDAIHCPAQKTNGIKNCNTCELCDGTKNQTVKINLH